MTTNSHEGTFPPRGTEQPPETTLELLLREIGQPYTEEHRQLERELSRILAIVRLVEEYEKMRKAIEAAGYDTAYTLTD